MKVFLQNLLPKAGRADAPDARSGVAKVDGKAAAGSAAPQKPGAAGKPAAPLRREDDASGGRPRLALEAGDFIDRVPHHLLRFGDFDLHRPLLFDMGEISDRIARGIFTIPLADLLKLIPEMFSDDAQAQHAMEVRFPWQKVMQMVNESAAAQKDGGGETLAQKLRRLRTTTRPAARASVQEAPGETRREANSQTKRGAGREGESGWFFKRAITFEETSARGNASQGKPAAAQSLPDVPESAPPLFELPETKGTSGASKSFPPAAAPVERAAASPVPNRAPISDLMHLSEEPLRLAENPAPIPSSAAGAAKSGADDSEQKMNRTRIKFLEAQLKTLSSKHQDEVSMLKAEADRLVEKARAEKEKEKLELMEKFQIERELLAGAKDGQLAGMEADDRPGVAARQSRASELREGGEKAPHGAPQGLVEDSESRQAELTALEARIQPLVAELDSVKSERDQLAELLSQEEQKAAELAARLEFDVFALRVESAQIVAEERERAAGKIAELESRFAQERAGWRVDVEPGAVALDHERTMADRDLEIATLKKDRADHANAADAAKQALARLQAEREGAATELAEAGRRSQAARDEADRGLLAARTELERERQQVMAERQQILREMTARAGTSAGRKDEALARLREELEKAEALAAAQAEAHEQVAAQWEQDIQTYRKRIQAVLGERTALAAKLRAAESALQAAGGSVAESAA